MNKETGVRIAIVGRPNVGKSTLYNRLTGRKDAIVHNEAGVTRDRKYGKASLADLEFEIIDTPGLADIGKQSLAGRMSEQSLKALDDADVIFFVIDGRSGVTSDDEMLVRMIRKVGKPIVVLANKSENTRAVEANLIDSARLGLGEALPVSAEHGDGMTHIYEVILSFMSQDEDEDEDEYEDDTPHEEDAEEEEDVQRPIRFVIVGRPNVGKSTLVNGLLGEDRVLTGPEAGMTRDAICMELTWQGRPFYLVDTAGLRRKSRIEEDLEQLAVSSTLQALRYADVAVLMLDATQPLEKQDNTLAGLIEREGRACVIALNKADEIDVNEGYLKAFYHRLKDVVPQMQNIPIIPMVAIKGEGNAELMREVVHMYEVWNKRISTSKLNDWLYQMMEMHSPPLVNNRRLKFRYMTQTKARPPTFVVFCNMSKEVPDSYIRYLTNQLRKDFDLPGVPIRFLLRTGKNPYAGKK
ncbi:MAG: ribosome biogenesis GTPase Der [Alphaproteobacteria bacterium]|nr:MAG: ribosome biogenesis GTPase Der [Alphaproteobacteria bacterium]